MLSEFKEYFIFEPIEDYSEDANKCVETIGRENSLTCFIPDMIIKMEQLQKTIESRLDSLDDDKSSLY